VPTLTLPQLAHCTLSLPSAAAQREMSESTVSVGQQLRRRVEAKRKGCWQAAVAAAVVAAAVSAASPACTAESISLVQA
jgi:hypothetical protein